MKVTILLIFTILMNGSSLLSQVQDSAKSNEDNFMMVQLLINMDYEDNKMLIFEKSKKLTEVQKLFIYYDNQKSSTLPFFLNLILGLGIGSWVQGDGTGGMVGTVGQLGGLFLLYTSERSSSGMAGIGIGSIMTSYIYGLIRPWAFSKKFNNEFKTVLGINNIQGLSINPQIKVLENGEFFPELRIAVNLR